MDDPGDFPIENDLMNFDLQTPAYTVSWDADFPGAGSGWERIYRWNGRYVVVLSFDDETFVFDSLRDAIAGQDLGLVTEATQSITSTELSADEIARLLRTPEPGSYSVVINGEHWIGDGVSGFTRAR